jgi:hypothetical protein
VAPPISLPGRLQPPPTNDVYTALVECDWGDPVVLSIPANPVDPTDWASGFYLAKLTGLLSGKQSYIIFVVRDDSRPSQFLFQSSVTTYEAYNEWGGGIWGEKSLYVNGDPPIPYPCFGAARKVSFNRPYGPKQFNSDGNDDNYGVGAGEFLSTVGEGGGPGWEYNMVRFLEREGYDVTYCTDVDTHENANLLLPHNAFLSVGHDEYWSWEMRRNVEAARDQGVYLGFFTANACYWQIRFESDSRHNADRTIACYKYCGSQHLGVNDGCPEQPPCQGAYGTDDPLANDSDPSNDYLLTVQWREHPVNLPEASLLGVMYCIDCYGQDVALVITNGSHWIFANTGLTTGSLVPGMVGNEWDTLAPSSPAGTVVIAHSHVTDYQPPADMTLYRAPNAALVFAAGTFQLSWGLDDYNADSNVGPPNRTSRLSAGIQQMTRNLLNRFKGVVYVDGAYGGGNSDGSRDRPFRTVTDGYLAAQPGDGILIQTGAYHEAPLNLSKRVRLESRGGVVTMGP